MRRLQRDRDCCNGAAVRWKSGEPACANPGALEQRGNAANMPVDWAYNGSGIILKLQSLSGMSTFNQTVENVESAERSVSGVFTEAGYVLWTRHA